MRSILLPFLVSALALFSACGVKSPPIAPIRNVSPPLFLDCSPYDANCDATDPNYVPGLDPKKPADAKRIRELEEAARKKAGK